MPNKRAYRREDEIPPHPAGNGYGADVTIEQTESGPMLYIRTAEGVPLSEWPGLKDRIDHMVQTAARLADE